MVRCRRYSLNFVGTCIFQTNIPEKSIFEILTSKRTKIHSTTKWMAVLFQHDIDNFINYSDKIDTCCFYFRVERLDILEKLFVLSWNHFNDNRLDWCKQFIVLTFLLDKQLFCIKTSGVSIPNVIQCHYWHIG